MEYKVYVFVGDFKKKEQRHSLLRKVIESYCSETGVSDMKGAEVLIGAKGKPYIEGAPFKFNISHSDDIWMCMIGEGECGIDVQKATRTDFRKVAKRFFGECEQAYVEEYGKEGFYRIWVRREAYAKYTGDGFFGVMPSFVDEEGEPAFRVAVPHAKNAVHEAAVEDDVAYIREFYAGRNVFCACCTGGKDDKIEVYG